MNYALEHSLDRECLRIRIGGTWPAGKAENLIADMFRLWEKHQKPILIDIRDMADAPTVFRDYQEARQFADAGFYRAGRIAVLDIPQRREANSFFETTSRNCGLTIGFFYADEEDAIVWLLPQKKGSA